MLVRFILVNMYRVRRYSRHAADACIFCSATQAAGRRCCTETRLLSPLLLHSKESTAHNYSGTRSRPHPCTRLAVQLNSMFHNPLKNTPLNPCSSGNAESPGAATNGRAVVRYLRCPLHACHKCDTQALCCCLAYCDTQLQVKDPKIRFTDAAVSSSGARN